MQAAALNVSAEIWIGIVAVARKPMVGLWCYLEENLIPDGAAFA